MFTLSRTTLATVLVAASVSIAYAQTQPPAASPQGAPGPGMMGNRGGMMGGGMMGAQGGMMGRGMMNGAWDTESYLGQLKGRLAITADQDAAWKDYADTVSAASAQMQAAHQTMFDAMGTATWQERRDMMNNMFEARQQAFDTVHAAAIKLLPALDAKQKATAQNILPGLAARPGMMGMRGPAPR